jgi:malonate-semialdehyde dehydrogenase (acetylating)/methylmalonate-semialdehyde dehydrogenase
MTETLPLFLNGKPEPAAAVDFLELKAPATGKPYARVPLCERGDVDRAVGAAAAAFPGWRATPVVERARVLFRYRQMLEAEADGLARLIANDHGKVLSDARGEVQRGIEVVEFACGMPTLMQGSTVEDVARGIDCHSIRQPLGVCVGITPFNFPAMVPLWMYPVAIAAGNTFVLKPSERVPRTALRLAELFKEAGLPDGVFNILHGDRRTVDALIEHPQTRAVSFVGSEPVARAVYRKAGEHGKRVQALSGAKNHLVVLPDCDLDKTIEGIMGGGYGSAGERCMAVSVVVAVGAVADPLVERIRQTAAALKVGEGSQPGSEMGPLITAEHKRRVTGHIDTGEREGARLVLDGRTHPAAGGPGNFVGPTLFDAVQPAMAIYRDEIFGPVLSVVRVPTLDDAIALINANPYGNGTAIFTSDGGAARKFQNEVHVGMIGVNVSVPVPLAFFPFAGWRGSFFGDLHVHGRDGVNFYTETKVVTARWFQGGAATARNMTIRLG